MSTNSCVQHREKRKENRQKCSCRIIHSTHITHIGLVSFPRLLANKMTTSVTLQMMERTQTFQWLGSPKKCTEPSAQRRQSTTTTCYCQPAEPQWPAAPAMSAHRVCLSLLSSVHRPVFDNPFLFS